MNEFAISITVNIEAENYEQASVMANRITDMISDNV